VEEKKTEEKKKGGSEEFNPLALSISQKRGRSRKGKIPTTAYNRKVLTYSQFLGDCFEATTGKDFSDFVVGKVLNEIGKENNALKEWLVSPQGNFLIKELPKVTEKTEAETALRELNKCRNYANSKFKISLPLLQTVITE